MQKVRLFNTAMPSVLRVPKLSTAAEGVRIQAGNHEYAFTLAGRQLILKRKDGNAPHIFTGECTVGRNQTPSIDYNINDPLLSGMHFSVRVVRDTVEITDHRSTNGTVVEWVDPGELMIRQGLDDPDLLLVIEGNQKVLEAEETERELALYGDAEFKVSGAGGLERLFEEEGSCWVSIVKNDGWLEVADMSDKLTGLRLCTVYRSIDRFNRERIN